MMGEMVRKIGILISVILVAMIALTVFSGTLLTNVTNPVSDEFTSTDTSTASTLTLSNTHWFTDASEITATGSSSGSLTINTDSTTLDTTRTILTLQAQTPGATETVTVNYVTEDVDSEGTVGWKLVPLFLIMLALFAVGTSIFIGVRAGREGQIGSLLVAIAVLFLGVILGEIVKDFSDDAIALYNTQPDYTGVGTLLPIVDLGYVFALFGIAAGGVAGFGSKLFRG